MANRTGHGTGKGQPRIEVLPPDELPPPVAADRADMSGLERRHNGQVAGSEAAASLGRQGGRAKATRVALARELGLGDVDNAPAFRRYRTAANAFRRLHCSELATMAGGELGAGPCSMVASAALQLAASRFVFDQATRTGDAAQFKTASALSNDSRQNLLAAYELAVREAAARMAATMNVTDLHRRILSAGRPKAVSGDGGAHG